ncbi:MAG TPA: HAMP domain-containing sensor histidine kinase [Candidatus Limnocylindrales bacterium]|nr:HAMP domain-containing sensor histidine kinase [Candidatus Limnocylindrales bacterium]
MSLRVRLAAAFALVAVVTAVAVAITAPTIVGRGFAAMQGDVDPGGMGRGQGPGPMAGAHAQQIQQETTVTLIAVAAIAAGGASLLGFWLAGRLVRPLSRLQRAAGAVAGGRLDARSGLGERTDEIGSLGRSFDTMAAELEAAESARRRFFQDAAHELKTPLAVIDATTSAVLDGVYAHEDRHLETIRDQARLLARIVDDLRTISLADAGVLPLHREPIAVGPLLASVARDMASRATGRGVSVETVEPAALSVSADPDRLRQVIGSLVDNAIRHTPSGGWVRLEGRPAAGSLVILSVTDSGAGIAPEDLPRVFERFYQADPARDRATGSSGLGLAIVRAVVELHGGRVSASNEPGAGARFEVELPAVA